ncbi:MAG TPA: serine hydrolase [Polyangiaceae bacterium]|jgi:CubicO group peptidase (beta-lactamase class C family)|nr:serine hydrolase [Polyangiaceae bacterium]
MPRFLRRLRLVVTVLLGLTCNGCIYARLFYFNDPNLDAPSYFDERVVRASTTPAPFVKGPEAKLELTPKERARYRTFDEFLESQGTRAFVVVHDDAVVYERYFAGVTASTELPSFSMSKTYAATLLARAVSDGLLPSMDAKLVTYVPELAAKPGYRDITLDELLRMTSGIDFDETTIAGPLFYYTTDLRRMMHGYDVAWRPGTHYLYGSLNVQLLWEVLHRRLGDETVTHYFERQVWGPLGATHAASWSLDSDTSGIEKFSGGFNSTARDHARIGLLYLHGGLANGRRILPEEWVTRSLTPDPVAGLVHTTDDWVRRGRYQWFLTRNGRAFFAKGYEGQYIFVVPAKHAVFVRFGEGYGETNWPSLFLRIADRL